VAAVILMVTPGSGATAKVTGDISKLGSNMLHARPGQDKRGPGGVRMSADDFEIADVTAIKNGIAGLAAVAPVAQTSRQAILGSANWSTSITGSTNDFLTFQGYGLAAVSLLVGGIGIMNIMMVSVTERTREIGTRLAIGALEREVMLQFPVEAVVLASCGGLIGIVMGFGSAAAGAHLIGAPFVLKPGIVLTAFLFSGFVGVAFGYYPARKAAQLKPIEALRYE
jgi:predicted lysophospholipase L1 biosynthesis ABC-type transport system permease subunit